jgi:hypothetical protein
VHDELERKRSWPNLMHYPRFWLEVLRETPKSLSQDCRSMDQGLKQGPPEYEAAVLILDHEARSCLSCCYEYQGQRKFCFLFRLSIPFFSSIRLFFFLISFLLFSLFYHYLVLNTQTNRNMHLFHTRTKFKM